MARRKRTTLIEDLFTIASRLPWWASITLAAAAWITLHPVATAELPRSTGPGAVADLLPAQIFKSLAFAGQYLLPTIFGAGAFVSAVVRFRRRAIFIEASSGGISRKLNALDWKEFEQLIGEWFRRRGYAVSETGGGGADGGIDLRLKKGSEVHLVQCKHWRAQRVGVQIIRELYGVMSAYGADGGFVVTSGRYTDDAKNFATGRNIELIDGGALSRWLSQYQTERYLAEKRQQEIESAQAPSAPPCPNCRSAMILRTAKRGSNAGNKFWGCTHFPACRGVRPAAD